MALPTITAQCHGFLINGGQKQASQTAPNIIAREIPQMLEFLKKERKKSGVKSIMNPPYDKQLNT